MARFPLTIHVKPYSGNVESRKRKHLKSLADARRIQDYINERQDRTVSEQVFAYYSIANDLGISKESVRQILQPIGHGSNGITMTSGELIDNGDLD